MILEAMKMQMPLLAPMSGKVKIKSYLTYIAGCMQVCFV